MKRKILFIAIILIALAMILVACGDDSEPTEQLPTCQEACTQSQDNHLGRNDDRTLAKCDHNGKMIQGDCSCTEQTAVITGTTIPITKATGVTVEQMDAAVDLISSAWGILWADIGGIHLTTSGKQWAFSSNKILSMNVLEVINEDMCGWIFYEIDNGYINPGDTGPDVVAMHQPQIKSTFLAAKGNKGHEWVAKVAKGCQSPS